MHTHSPMVTYADSRTLSQNGAGGSCTMACMSRAGREPGFKKQNQDNCFAFEKYITNEQSLFGAFDGHGPNGILIPPLCLP